MQNKRFVALVLLLPLAALACCAFLVYAIDPAMQYHAPWFGISQVYTDERSQNAGLAKSADYDTIVIGSSVTSNFRVSWFNEAFDCKAVKLCYPGGTFSDYDAALETAFATHEVERVFWCVDPNLLIASPENSTPLPDYLYDDDLSNDYQYLFNKDVLLKQCMPALLDTLTGTQEPYDEAFVWDYGYTYSLTKATESYIRPPQSETEQPRDYYHDIAAQNWAYLDKWISSHPETIFYLYFPPYSTLYLDHAIRTGTSEATYYMLIDTMDRYIKRYNVEFYSFLLDPVTTDFNNYTDMVHFRSEINRYMVDYMATHEPYAAREDLYGFMEQWEYRTKHYKFDTLFSDYYNKKG